MDNCLERGLRKLLIILDNALLIRNQNNSSKETQNVEPYNFQCNGNSSTRHTTRHWTKIKIFGQNLRLKSKGNDQKLWTQISNGNSESKRLRVLEEFTNRYAAVTQADTSQTSQNFHYMQIFLVQPTVMTCSRVNEFFFNSYRGSTRDIGATINCIFLDIKNFIQ